MSDADRGQPFARGGQFTGRSLSEEEVERARAEHPPPPPAADPAPGAGEAEEGADDALARLAAERDEYRDDLQRLAAEFDNYRKRSRRELEQATQVAGDRLLVELLGVLDDIERAANAEGDAASLMQGVAMVRDRFRGVLEAAGLREIDTSGLFDPNLHEAVLVQPVAGVADGTILEVAQRGFAVNDRVVRHAKVVVAGQPG